MVERVWPFAPPRRRWPFPGSLSPSEARSLWSGLRRHDFWAGARLLERPAWLSDSPPEERVVTLEPLLMRTRLSSARVWGFLAVQGTHLSLLWFDFYFHLPKCTSIYFFTWEKSEYCISKYRITVCRQEFILATKSVCSGKYKRRCSSERLTPQDTRPRSQRLWDNELSDSWDTLLSSQREAAVSLNN